MTRYDWQRLGCFAVWSCRWSTQLLDGVTHQIRIFSVPKGLPFFLTPNFLHHCFQWIVTAFSVRTEQTVCGGGVCARRRAQTTGNPCAEVTPQHTGTNVRCEKTRAG